MTAPKCRIYKDVTVEHPVPAWRLRQPDGRVRYYRTWFAAISGWPSQQKPRNGEWPWFPVVR